MTMQSHDGEEAAPTRAGDDAVIGVGHRSARSGGSCVAHHEGRVIFVTMRCPVNECGRDRTATWLLLAEAAHEKRTKTRCA